MWKNKICILLGKISITVAFSLMLIFGFIELVKTSFVFYDAIVIKLDFWTGNLAHVLWNLLTIVAFFVFVIGSIWKMKHRVLFWIFGVVYVLIGNLTLIFIIIDFVNGKIMGVKLAIGIIIAFLLILGSVLLLFIVSTVNQGTKLKKNKTSNQKSEIIKNKSTISIVDSNENNESIKTE